MTETVAVRHRPASEPVHVGIAPALRSLVGKVQATLGQVVREAEGEATFRAIEAVRGHMVAFRDAEDPAARTRALRAAQRALRGLDGPMQARLARAYTLYLELTNVCENAYRTHRLRARRRQPGGASADGPRADIVWVLTAHPTESRSPENIRLLRRVQSLLTDSLEAGREPDAPALRHMLFQAWRVGSHPRSKPSVVDEARHIFSLLTDSILEELVAFALEGHRVRLRTWVGGDKDGHPGVGPDETAASLGLSRARLVGFCERWLAGRFVEDARLLGEARLVRAAARLQDALAALGTVEPGDGGRVRALGRALTAARKGYSAFVGVDHPELERMVALLDLFPALVVPLELREERGLFGAGTPIAQMMRYLGQVAAGGSVEGYVRGVVVSMASSADDLVEAAEAVERELGGAGIPVIPLFELPEVLRSAARILREAWARPAFRRLARRRGGPFVEVMLGYSDTAKRMGVLSSRLGIHDAMGAIGAWAREAAVPVLFFHGSGGSVGRGGGTFEEQAATWPSEAAAIVKQTIQGEMVERTLATPEILRRQVEQIALVQHRPPRYVGPSAVTRALARVEEQSFVARVADPALRALLGAATPYARLGALTIGSRPSKRKANAANAASAAPGLDELRAIPWVLCWTQTRYLLHAWLGIGAAWRDFSESLEATGRSKASTASPRSPAASTRAADELSHALARDPLLRSHLRQLGFTLAKVEPQVFAEYVRALAPKASKALQRALAQELADARALAGRVAADGELLPDRRWLIESIHYRAPMIHPLNLLQIEVLSRPKLSPAHELLFRETVTGIAAGMLTTG